MLTLRNGILHRVEARCELIGWPTGIVDASAEVATAIFDELMDLADDLDPHAEATVAYTLLALTPLGVLSTLLATHPS